MLARSGQVRSMRGFTYIGLLFAIVLMGVLLSTAGVMWNTAARREKEAELLFVGNQYQKAIASYYAVSINGAARQLPPSVDELLLDHRFPMPIHHLRKRYIDPVKNSADWGFVREGDRIAAVYSLAEELPIKQSGFGPGCLSFGSAKSYSDWKFDFRHAGE